MHGTPIPLFRFGIIPGKLFDYFAAGKPVISDLPCKYDPVEQMEAGIAADPPEPTRIAAQIMKMASMDEGGCQQCCMNAIQAAQVYDFETLIQKLVRIISEEV